MQIIKCRKTVLIKGRKDPVQTGLLFQYGNKARAREWSVPLEYFTGVGSTAKAFQRVFKTKFTTSKRKVEK